MSSFSAADCSRWSGIEKPFLLGAWSAPTLTLGASCLVLSLLSTLINDPD